MQNMGSLHKTNPLKMSAGKMTEESSIYAHADENTNAAFIITNRL